MATKNDYVKTGYLVEKFTKEHMVEFIKCQNDVFYFCRTYVKVQHSIKGALPFELYPFQEEILHKYKNNRYNIVLTARQMGKTSVSAAYILWFTIFHSDKTTLIVANQMMQAMEIMDRIRYAYEELPSWLKPGTVTYNKGSVEFDNGSRIISRATTAMAARGLSISLLYLDEFAFVPPRIAEEFWAGIGPVLSTGGSCIITSTPNSDEDQFAQLWHGATNIYDEYGNLNPDGVGINGFMSSLHPWNDHPERDQKWADAELAKAGFDKFEREFNCKFIQADETLINPLTLANMKSIEPIRTGTANIRWYKEPMLGKTYLVGLDPSLGTGGDYAAIQVFQIPEMIQIAEWKHNRTPVKKQVAVLQRLMVELEAKLIDLGERNIDINWTVEANGLGAAPLQVIRDTGEEYFPGTLVHEPRKPTKGAAPFGKKKMGLVTNQKNRIEAMTKLKSLVETNRMHIYSKPLISELKAFVSNGKNTFRAKYGAHDDLISSTLLCMRLLLILAKRDPDLDEKLKESIMDDDDFIEPLPMLF